MIQVKFAANPSTPASSLNWRWLTNHTKRSTSLLAKWSATTLDLRQDGCLGSAVLMTDRIPDPSFAASLSGRFVNYESLPQPIKCLVDQQIGSPRKSRAFFSTFEFIHSKPQIDDLERRLWTRMSSDTDRGGWLSFLEQVRLWSTRKNQPYPDGKIRFHHLRQAISVERPKPISQDFAVPDTYCSPDERFDVSFLDEITTSDGITVLWGPPGRGKSTYLSQCVAAIDSSKAVFVRHHYFLSVRDRSEARYRYHAIAHSLRFQLDDIVPEENQTPKTLRERLESAAALLHARNVRLVVIIDGLDHVWRDRRDRHEMQALFDDLIPLPAGIRLVIGTQKIAHQHLPSRLLQYHPEERWTELPSMTPSAIRTWLGSQDRVGRLLIDAEGSRTRVRLLHEIADAFHAITHGLPLHLVYSFEALVSDGRSISARDVDALPDCPTGDIRKYYAGLWHSISATAQSFLHVLAGLRFGPPAFAIAECLGFGGDAIEALHSIKHLLYYRETEVVAFHPSLFGFVRDVEGHETQFVQHAVGVRAWLENVAPPYWRWAWSWITGAQVGDSKPLLGGPSREWAIEALVAGYPRDQLVTIIGYAERVAFDACDFPRFLSLRLLKARAVDGPDYETNDWHVFLEAAYSLAGDSSVHALLRDSVDRADVDVIPYIVRASDRSVRHGLAKEAITALNRRIGDVIWRNADTREDMDAAQVAIAAVLSSGSTDVLEEIDAWTKRSRTTDSLRASYVRQSLIAGRNNNVISAGMLWTSPQVDRDVLAALCLEGLTPEERPGLLVHSHPAVRCLSILKGRVQLGHQVQIDLSSMFAKRDFHDPAVSHTIRRLCYQTYFSSLAVVLCGGTALGRSKIPIGGQTCWLGEAVRALELAADQIGRNWVASQSWPTLREFFAMFDLGPPDLEAQPMISNFRGFSSALRDIAFDMCAIALGIDSNSLIDLADIAAVVESPYWDDEGWLSVLLERRIRLHTCASAQYLIERITASLGSDVTEFPDRSITYAKLALFASDYDLLLTGRTALRCGLSCVLGYGWHKDMFAFEVLESIDMLIHLGNEDARHWLLDLAGAYEKITDYTDGDETGAAREEYYKTIANHYPNRVPRLYAQLIQSEDWYYAERVAVAFGETSEIECRSGRLLVETFLPSAEFNGLLAPESADRPVMVAATSTVARRTGRFTSAQTGQHRPDPKDEEPEPASNRASPSDYPPGKLDAYMHVSSPTDRYGEEGERAAAWLQHWDSVGCARVALSEFESACSEVSYDTPFANAFLIAFSISLRTQGRTEAFPWLTRAFVASHGWARWFSDQDCAHASMRAVATNYPLRWYEFIQSTAVPAYPSKVSDNGVSIGLSTLVRFLLEVGQTHIAIACASVMVSTFKEELSQQPIQRPDWSQ